MGCWIRLWECVTDLPHSPSDALYIWINESHLLKSSFCAQYVLSDKRIVIIHDGSHYVQC